MTLLGGEPAAKKPLMQGIESIDCAIYWQQLNDQYMSLYKSILF
jgi:hypothetical protein